MNNDTPVTHYAASTPGEALCGTTYRTVSPGAQRGDSATPLASDMTCPDYLAEFEQLRRSGNVAESDAVLHAATPVEFASRGVAGVRLGPRCGATGPTALTVSEVTCPACLALANVTTVRTSIERAQNSIGSVVMDLCVWEGRGDWAALPADHRCASGLRGLEHLGEAIAELEARRAELRAALGLP